MGCWGMGMTQSDQFMETYETFMDEYNEGAAVPNITKKIRSVVCSGRNRCLLGHTFQKFTLYFVYYTIFVRRLHLLAAFF